MGALRARGEAFCCARGAGVRCVASMIVLDTPRGPWHLVDGAAKLEWRAALPGASVYDRCAHTLRMARARRLPLEDLLALALPASWTVNSRAASPVFQRWLQPAAREAWTALIGALAGGVGPWLGMDAAHRDRVSFLAGALVTAGGDLCSLSKALALLCPEGVPLMDDGALWMLLDAVPRPTTADAPTGEVKHLLPMLDAFARAVLTHEDALIPLARNHIVAVLDAPQTLDRLMWFDSWGWRHTNAPRGPQWREVRSEGRTAVVKLPDVPEGTEKHVALDAEALGEGAWADPIRAAFEGA